MTSIAPIRPTAPPPPAAPTPSSPSSPSILETDVKTFVSKHWARYADRFAFLSKMDSSKLALVVLLTAALLFIANGIFTLVALTAAIAVAAWAFGKIMGAS